MPIVYVKQTGAGNLYGKLDFTQSDYVITKSKPRSFSSEEFRNIINELNPNGFVVTGLMSNACVQATVRVLYKKISKLH